MKLARGATDFYTERGGIFTDATRASDGEGILGVAEPVDPHAHPVHQSEVETAKLAVRILAQIVGLAALDRAAATAGEDDGELARIVAALLPLARAMALRLAHMASATRPAFWNASPRLL